MKKRVDIVSIKLCKESSILYEPRKLTCSKDAFTLLHTFLSDKDREMFVVSCLDVKNQPTSINVCSIGSLSSSIVHPREVFKTAILSNASSIIVGHNHPSGNLEPSKEDIAITNRLKECGSILGIQVLDHLILGDNNTFLSFKEDGYL